MSDLLGLAIDVILCLYEKRRHYGFFQFSLYIAVILRHTHRDISGLLQRVSIRGIERPPDVPSNFNKRMVKTPKLYFIDTGMAAWLLGIQEQEELTVRPAGALFENLVVTEFLKGRFNKGQQADIYFWRDSKKGLEVDLLLDDGSSLKPVEIKSGQTVVPDFMTSIRK
jgi:predicted AAA+ superfamily ATPase